jgi:type II secretory pathway component HofQ
VRGNLSATIGALLTRSRGKVIQAPRAFTINGLPVVFSSVVERPVIIQEAYSTDFFVRTTTTIEIFPVQISLFAVPFINADNTVTVFILPIVQDIPEFVQNPAGGTIPVVSSTFTQALIRVRDGESFAIGGLLRTRNSEARREVPLLARLPFIGSLFKTKAQDVDEKNLVIFVTPRIVRAEEITPKEL